MPRSLADLPLSLHAFRWVVQGRCSSDPLRCQHSAAPLEHENSALHGMKPPTRVENFVPFLGVLDLPLFADTDRSHLDDLCVVSNPAGLCRCRERGPQGRATGTDRDSDENEQAPLAPPRRSRRPRHPSAATAGLKAHQSQGSNTAASASSSTFPGSMSHERFGSNLVANCQALIRFFKGGLAALTGSTARAR